MPSSPLAPARSIPGVLFFPLPKMPSFCKSPGKPGSPEGKPEPRHGPGSLFCPPLPYSSRWPRSLCPAAQWRGTGADLSGLSSVGLPVLPSPGILGCLFADSPGYREAARVLNRGEKNHGERDEQGTGGTGRYWALLLYRGVPPWCPKHFHFHLPFLTPLQTSST